MINPFKSKYSNLTIRVNRVSFKMIYVNGDTFDMGATPEQGDDYYNFQPYYINPYDDEYPVHQVTLSDYYIGKFQVTQGLWKAVMGNNPSKFQNGDNYPVENVSWDDCQEFIKKLNQMTGRTFALPTEAQWEFAARGGTKSKHYKYSGSKKIDAVAWHGEGCDTGSTHPVRKKKANELGIYDMSGNVWEWCSDWYDKNYYQNSPSTNPQGPSTGSLRMLRGGSWSRNAYYCRVSIRHGSCPDYYYNKFGFRLMLLP